MREVVLAPEVDTLLDDLWNQGQEQLVGKVEDAIDLAAAGDREVRRHRIDSPLVPEGVWLVPIKHEGRTWALVWSELADGSVKVHALGQTEAF